MAERLGLERIDAITDHIRAVLIRIMYEFFREQYVGILEVSTLNEDGTMLVPKEVVDDIQEIARHSLDDVDRDIFMVFVETSHDLIKAFADMIALVRLGAKFTDRDLLITDEGLEIN